MRVLVSSWRVDVSDTARVDVRRLVGMQRWPYLRVLWPVHVYVRLAGNVHVRSKNVDVRSHEILVRLSRYVCV